MTERPHPRTETHRAHSPRARAIACAGVAVGLLVGCAGVDAAESALVVLDDEARAAGVRVEVHGEAQEGTGPIAVPAGGGVAVAREGIREAVEARPGEVIAVEGPEGRVRRDADPERLVVRGDARSAQRFAELGGMDVIPLPDGRFLIDGENAMWTALLFPDASGVEISPWAPAAQRTAWAPSWAGGAEGWGERTAVDIGDETGAEPTLAAPSTDLAAYVGAYVADDVVLVLDAQGGLHMTGRGVERRGSFALDERARLVFRFEDGAVQVSSVGEDLRDASGVRFRTMPVARPVTVERSEP